MRCFGQAEATDDLLVRGTGYLALTDLPRQLVEPRTTRRVRLKDFAQLLIGRVRHTVDRHRCIVPAPGAPTRPRGVIARVNARTDPVQAVEAERSEPQGSLDGRPPHPSRALPRRASASTGAHRAAASRRAHLIRCSAIPRHADVPTRSSRTSAPSPTARG